jgi:hypothetical protein
VSQQAIILVAFSNKQRGKRNNVKLNLFSSYSYMARGFLGKISKRKTAGKLDKQTQLAGSIWTQLGSRGEL